MRRIHLLVVTLGLVVMLLAACAPGAGPASAPAAPAKQAKAAWEVNWERVQAEAKKEGELIFFTSGGEAVRRALVEGFQDRFGIPVKSSAGTGGTFATKILTELRAGLYLWDIFMSGGGTQVTVKAGGGTVPLEPALILPDLTDPAVIKKVWYKGQLAWIDRDRHLIIGCLAPSVGVAINTSLVKPGEIKSWDDLLNPKWKGKIMLMIPTRPANKAGAQIMPMLYQVKGEEWVRKLAAQEPKIIDERLGDEWLAHGKYPIYIGINEKGLDEMARAGAPVAAADTRDAIGLSSGVTVLSLLKSVPHPNAASTFINWYLSKDGQTILSKAWGQQSARLDVPTDFLSPSGIRQPGQAYWEKDREDEVYAKVPEYVEQSKKIFGSLIQ